MKYWICLPVALLLTACSSAPVGPLAQPDGAPKVDGLTLAQLARLPDPEVTAVTPSRYGNKPVYTVFGKSYRVMQSAEGFTEEGLASWYGIKFHGRRTSSGETFDTYALTGAHKHLPIPVYVRVTNLNNGRQTIVRVNDRGPFHPDRIIDLSYAAAVKLGFHDHGTARVRIEVVEPVDDRFVVKAGNYLAFADAARQQQVLADTLGRNSVVIKERGMFRLRMGPIQDQTQLDRLKAVLVASDVQPIQVLLVP